MLNGKTVHQISTKVDENADSAKATTVTLDWTGVSDELVKSIATRQIIVTLQGKFRRDATAKTDAKPIPSTFAFKVADYGSKTPEPVTVETTLARASALTPDEQKALLAQLTANLGLAEPAKGQQPKK